MPHAYSNWPNLFCKLLPVVFKKHSKLLAIDNASLCAANFTPAVNKSVSIIHAHHPMSRLFLTSIDFRHQEAAFHTELKSILCPPHAKLDARIITPVIIMPQYLR